MKRAAGLGKGSLRANQRGSVWPCGETMGRSLTVSYSLAATERATPSAGKSRFASRIFIYASQSQFACESASTGSVSKIAPYFEQMGILGGKRGAVSFKKKRHPEGCRLFCVEKRLGDVVTHSGEDHAVGRLGSAADAGPGVASEIRV